MKKLNILLFTALFCLFSISAQNSYGPYQESINSQLFLPAGASGGGTIQVNIDYNTLSISGFVGISGSSNLKTGQIAQINAPYTIPNSNLGFITNENGNVVTSYQLEVVNNWITISSTTNEPVSYLQFSMSIDLTPSDPNDNTPNVASPDVNENYVYVLEATRAIDGSLTSDIDATTNTYTLKEGVLQSITYYDGLGRETQSIGIGMSPNGKDIITHIEYDPIGRMEKEFLPYPSSTQSNGAYISSSVAQSEQESYFLSNYAGDLNATNPNPFSQKNFDHSPLNRVLEQAAPGEDWALGSNHTIKFDYSFNGFEEVHRFGIAHPLEGGQYNTEKTILVYNNNYYNPNELYKTITKDENWTSADGHNHTIEEFTNKQGQIVLKRTYNNNEAYDTYYVYDDYGNLTYVLPPEASDDILNPNSDGRTASITNHSWVNLANVDTRFADDYNRQLEDYDNANILNADIQNAYGGQGGFTVSTFSNSEEVVFSINFSATQALALKRGELVSLRDYGEHRDTELGRIAGEGYEYVFTIRNNAIHVDGEGELHGINQVFNSNTRLSYDHTFLWTHFVDIDSRFASTHEDEVLTYASATNQDPLNVYLSNQYGGQGGLNITIDENDLMTLSFNINTSTPLLLKQGVVANLNTERRLADQYLGTLSNGGYSYDLELMDNNIVVTGSGSGSSFGGTIFPNPPNTNDFIVDTAVIEGLCYIYHYDYRNRLIEKKIPGKGWEYIIYNKLDQPVLTQDAKQRLDDEWLFTKYDVFGRVVYTGKHNYTPTGSDDNSGRLELQTTFNTQTNHYEEREATVSTIEGTNVYYSNQTLPNTNLELLTINYYDSYTNLGLSVDLTKNYGDMVYDEAIETNAKSLPVVSKVRVLETDNWNTTVTYYDDEGKPIFSASDNEYLHTLDVVEIDYDFVGKVVESKNNHEKNGLNTNSIIVEDYSTYDHIGRLITQTQELNDSGQLERIVNNHYNELGQLENKDVGGDTQGIVLQTVDYNYNIRGWLKEINNPNALGNDLFAFKINYNNPEHSSNALFNGNISETFWKTANDNNLRGYDYTYDALNRIVSGNYHKPDPSSTENYSLSDITYDKNGNIFTLKRHGLREDNNTITIIDDLEYDYEEHSNRLFKVDDSGTNDGFKDVDSGLQEDYLYDVNGNMITDANREIASIEYNHLNLPTRIVFNTGNSIANDEIQYVYDATGVKLKKKIIDMSENNGVNLNSNTITEYAGNYIYKETANYSHNGTHWVGNEVGHGLQLFSQPEGYIEPKNDGSVDYRYVYQYKDHLGNIRLSYSNDYNGTLEIVEENNYYPFGLKHKGYNNLVSANTNNIAQKFKYNGVELEESLGLNLYEMDMRQYDPAIARWIGLDPVIHYSMSTYTAFDNNPAIWADPSGADSELPDWLMSTFNASGSGWTWYNVGNGGFSTKKPTNGSSNNDSRTEKEDCCGGYGLAYIHKAAKERAEKEGVSTKEIWDAYMEGYKKGLKLGLEIVTFVIPGGLVVKGVLKGGKWIYAIYKGSKIVKTGAVAFKSFKFASKYGIQGYSKLKAAIKGTGLEAHHLIEKRFANILGEKASQMASIALTKAEHQIFTKAWRAEIGYKGSKSLITTANATAKDIYNAAKKIYKDYPEILKVLGL